MASKIEQYLNKILSSRFGKDVRQAIHDGIEQCYDDVTNPDLNTEAFETAVQNKIDSGALALMTIPDGSITKEKLNQDITENIETNTQDIADLKSAMPKFTTLEVAKLICEILEYCAFTDPSVSTLINQLKKKLDIDSSHPDLQVNLTPYCTFESPVSGIAGDDKRIGVKVSYSFEAGDTIKLNSPIGDNYRLAVGNNNYSGPWIGGGYLDVSNEYTFSDSDISSGYGKVLLIKRTDEAVIQQDDIDNIKICLVVIKHG